MACNSVRSFYLDTQTSFWFLGFLQKFLLGLHQMCLLIFLYELPWGCLRSSITNRNVLSDIFPGPIFYTKVSTGILFSWFFIEIHTFWDFSMNSIWGSPRCSFLESPFQFYFRSSLCKFLGNLKSVESGFCFRKSFWNSSNNFSRSSSWESCRSFFLGFSSNYFF